MSISIHDFAKLFLAKMAGEISSDGVRVTRIPFNYRQRIENVMCANDSWKKDFSTIINTKEYFEDHFFWEELLAQEIIQVIDELKLKIYFDFVNENMYLFLSEPVIDQITSNFSRRCNSAMEYFVSLITDMIYSRQFQEKFVDYTARTRKKIRKLEESVNKA